LKKAALKECLAHLDDITDRKWPKKWMPRPPENGEVLL